MASYRPMKNTITEPSREIPIYKRTDVLVVGGGPAGIMAALAAAREGRSVVLVEKNAFLGGNLAIALPILGFLSRKGVPIIKGLPQELVGRLAARGAASPHTPCPLHVSFTLFEPDALKFEAMEMLLEAGVEVLLHTTFSAAIVEGGVIKGCVFQGKGRREAILASIVVDCTGDADVCLDAGADCEKGGADGGMMPSTLMFRLRDADTEKFRRTIAAGKPGEYELPIIPPNYFGRNSIFIAVGLHNLMEKARADGIRLLMNRVIFYPGMKRGEVWVNMAPAMGFDGADAHSLTAAEIAASRQIPDLVRFFTGYVPGFENAALDLVAPFIGVRDTRRVVCRQMLTREDILACRDFDDAIAAGSYPIDRHHSHDNGVTLEWCDDCYRIPYGSLVPLRVDNLLVAGRCAGLTHDAMSATRVMSTCMAMGEAAGRAAALCVAGGLTPATLDAQKLRASLRKAGAFF